MSDVIVITIQMSDVLVKICQISDERCEMLVMRCQMSSFHTNDAQGLVMCSKVKTRNLLSDFKSAFKSIKGGELTELSKLTQDVRY